MDSDVSRRGFVKGSLVVAASAVAGLGAQAAAAQAEEASWDAETDTVIVGMGFAGLSAAITDKNESLGDILVLDAADEDEAGGNSRVCGQILMVPETAEGGTEYQTYLNGDYEVDADYMADWGEGMAENLDWLLDMGADMQLNAKKVEYPEAPCADQIHIYAIEGKIRDARLWNFLKETADDLGVEYEYGTRVTDLALDPASREILGVITEDGRHIKARKGVILACGGFEANKEMMKTYLPEGYPRLFPRGTSYNVGDGIKLAQSVGADLWHMNNFSGSSYFAVLSNDYPEAGGEIDMALTKDFIFVGPKGRRFMYEEKTNITRHGKLEQPSGIWQMSPIVTPAWMVFGQARFDAGAVAEGWPNMTTEGQIYGIYEMDGGSNQTALEAGVIKKAETVEELAEVIGLTDYVDTLRETIETYNANAARNVDPDFGRGTEYHDIGSVGAPIDAFDLVPVEPPYYAISIVPQMFNTQGGPRKNKDCQVLDVHGQPIARLYAVGECGAVYGGDYNGGGNAGEAMHTGRKAMRSCAALEAWDK